MSGDAFLRTCKADFCVITVREHLEMVENMIRGGVSSIYEKRHLKCNNKCLGNNDPTQEETYGLLVDTNNLPLWRNIGKVSVTIERFCNGKHRLAAYTEHYEKLINRLHFRSLGNRIFRRKINLYIPAAKKENSSRRSDKTNYTLKLCASPGLEVAKVHRVLLFHREKWLKSYIQLNTLTPQEAKNKFKVSTSS